MKSPGAHDWATAVVDQLKAERVILNMSMGELAQKAGVSPRTVTRYFNGERDMTLGSVEKFAIALGLDLHTILRRAEKRESDT